MRAQRRRSELVAPRRAGQPQRARRWGGIVDLWLLWLVGATTAWAQTDTVSVSIRPPLAYAGEEVRCPVYLEGGGAKTLRRLSLELRFPARLLSFVEVERSFLLERPGVQVESRTVEEQNEVTALVVEVTAGQEIGEGLILYLQFRVDSTAVLGSAIELTTHAVGDAVQGDAANRATLEFPAEVIQLSPRRKEEEFIFACFFYMH